MEDEKASDEASKGVDWKLVRIVQRYKKKKQKEDYDLDDVSPLSEEILIETFSTKFKMSSLDKYDETEDPRSHLAIFRTTMQLHNVNNFVLYGVFSSTLTSLAQKWYQRLSSSSINSFNQLAMLFKYKFITCIPHKKLLSDLQKIRQGESEPLWSFISRFNTKAIQIKELNHKIACEALKKETHNINFMDSLVKNPTVTYQQLMDKAQKYIRLDDEVQTLKDDKRTS